MTEAAAKIECQVDGCARPARARRLCVGHYQRLRDGRPLAPPLRILKGRGELRICQWSGCQREHHADGLCWRHYNRKRQNQPMADAAYECAPIGTRRINGHGYATVKTAVGQKRWPLEHRVVMEKTLGRKLAADETVHHRNGDKLDNRPENLELWVGNHPRGARARDIAIEYLANLTRAERAKLVKSIEGCNSCTPSSTAR